MSNFGGVEPGPSEFGENYREYHPARPEIHRNMSQMSNFGGVEPIPSEQVSGIVCTQEMIVISKITIGQILLILGKWMH